MHSSCDSVEGMKSYENYKIDENVQDNESLHFYGVCDGHGDNGHHVSAFAKRRLQELIEEDYGNLEFKETEMTQISPYSNLE